MSTPPLADMRPLAKLFEVVGISRDTMERWRKHPSCPVPCWLVGGRWMSTEEAISEWIAARTAQALGVEAPTPLRRKRELEEEARRVAELLKPRAQRGARA